ncbi:MAG: cytochrome B [Nitrospirota bacterium]
MSRPKLRAAFFSFTDCEGCQLEVANLGQTFMELADVMEIVSFREIMSEHDPNYDVIFLEGSVASRHDEDRIKYLSARAQITVALGACATIGGVNNLKNLKSLGEQKKIVYGSIDPAQDSFDAKPVDEVVRIDYYIHGCPIYGPEFLTAVKAILAGKPYKPPAYPVCVECKANENECVYLKNEFCLGPITRAGCNSWMINHGSVCVGCRGLIDNPATDAQRDILERFGLTAEEILDKFNLYCQSKKEKAKYARDFAKPEPQG